MGFTGRSCQCIDGQCLQQYECEWAATDSVVVVERVALIVSGEEAVNAKLANACSSMIVNRLHLTVLLQWKGLPYGECTFETPEAISEAGGQDQLDQYEVRHMTCSWPCNLPGQDAGPVLQLVLVLSWHSSRP